MTRPTFVLFAGLASLGLSACSSESPEPVEQIVVRDPGTAAPAQSAVPPADTGDLVAAGKAAFAACVACHTADAGGAAGIGPNLYGVVGRASGSVEGFGYSDAMKSAGLTWDASELDAFLTNPAAKVPGTSMGAGSVGDAEKRAAIIAYLSSLSE